jgi:hypothetical protein
VYDETVEELGAEIGDDLDDAKFTLKRVEEKVVPALVKLEREATSVLLQVLYALHRGHVQFLMTDYKSRIIEVYPDAFHAFAHLAGRVFYAPRVQRIRTDKPCQIVTGSDGVTSIVTEGLEPGTVAVNGDWGRFFNDWLGRCGTLGGTVGSNRDHRPQMKQDFQEFFSRM